MIIEIDPTVDFACKLLLGNPEYPAITLHFLNSVLRPASPIVHVMIVNPIVGKKYEEDKLSILDILAIDASGRRFNIEIQRELRAWLPKRLTFYAASQFVEQLSEGDSYQKLSPSIGICILDARLFPDVPQFHNEFRLRSLQGLELTDSLEVHLLELPKYLSPSDNGSITEPIEQWMYFFRNAKGSSPESLRRFLPDPIFADAAGVLEMIAKNPEERRMYEARLKMQLDQNSLIQAALEEGEIKGKIEGQIEGKKEGKIENAIKMIRSLQSILQVSLSPAAELQAMSLEQLDSFTTNLQNQIRHRLSS